MNTVVCNTPSAYILAVRRILTSGGPFEVDDRKSVSTVSVTLLVSSTTLVSGPQAMAQMQHCGADTHCLTLCLAQVLLSSAGLSAK